MCIPRNTSDSWDIPWYDTRKCCINKPWIASIWRVPGYLSADIICSEKRTVFRKFLFALYFFISVVLFCLRFVILLSCAFLFALYFFICIMLFLRCAFLFALCFLLALCFFVCVVLFYLRYAVLFALCFSFALCFFVWALFALCLLFALFFFICVVLFNCFVLCCLCRPFLFTLCFPWVCLALQNLCTDSRFKPFCFFVFLVVCSFLFAFSFFVCIGPFIWAYRVSRSRFSTARAKLKKYTCSQIPVPRLGLHCQF